MCADKTNTSKKTRPKEKVLYPPVGTKPVSLAKHTGLWVWVHTGTHITAMHRPKQHVLSDKLNRKAKDPARLHMNEEDTDKKES